MASVGSKGNKKRNSGVQKQHYAEHPYKLPKNKRAKLLRHIKRGLKAQARKGTALDQQAVDAYIRHGGSEDTIKNLARDMVS